MRQRVEKGYPIFHPQDCPEVIEHHDVIDEGYLKKRVGRNSHTRETDSIRKRVLAVIAAEPHLTCETIAKRFPGVTPRKVQYWRDRQRNPRPKKPTGWQPSPLLKPVLEFARENPSASYAEIHVQFPKASRTQVERWVRDAGMRRQDAILPVPLTQLVAEQLKLSPGLTPSELVEILPNTTAAQISQAIYRAGIATDRKHESHSQFKSPRKTKIAPVS